MIASLLALGLLSPAVEPAELRLPIRGCCAFGYDLPLRVGPLQTPIVIRNARGRGDLGRHDPDAGLGERGGALYTCAGGFLDLSHVRNTADAVARLAPLVARSAVTYEALGARVHIDFTPAAAADPIGAAQRAVFLLSVWHEVATARGARYVPMHDERFSAFSPEDLYSDLLGVEIAAEALEAQARSPGLSWGAAMDAALAGRLERLGALDAAGTRRAFDLAGGVLWDPRRAIPDHRLVLRRQPLPRGPVTPARVEHPACEGRVAEPLWPPRNRGARLRFEVDPALGLGEALDEAALLEIAYAPVPQMRPPREAPPSVTQRLELLGLAVEGEATQPVASLQLRSVTLNSVGGRLEIGHARLDLGEEVARSWVTAVEAPALFGCEAKDGEGSHAPLLALFHDCRSARIGLTGRLGRLAVAHRRGLTVAEPLSLGGALALVGPAHTPRHLTGRLLLSGSGGLYVRGETPTRGSALAAPLSLALSGASRPWPWLGLGLGLEGRRLVGEVEETLLRLEARLTLGVERPWRLEVGYAALHGGGVATRLLDPAPLPLEGEGWASALTVGLSYTPPLLTL